MLGVLLAGPLQALQLPLNLFAHSIRKRNVGDLLAVPRDGILVAVAQLFPDGRQLLAQVELALSLLEAFVDFDADLVFERRLGQNLATPGDQHLQTRDDVAFLQHFQVLVQFQVGRVAGHVGELARVFDAPQHLSNRRGAAQVQQVFQNRAVLPREALCDWRQGTVIHSAPSRSTAPLLRTAR